MKRIVSIWIAVLLLMFTACSTQRESALSGTWKTEVDYAAVINAFVAENDVLAASGVVLDSAPVTVTYTFSEDGTASCVLDQKQLYAWLVTMTEEVLVPVISALGSGMTLEQYMANTNTTEEALMLSLFTDESVTSIENALNFSGTYSLKGQRLSVTVDDKTSETAVSFDGDTLTLDASIGTTTQTEVQQTAVQALFPLVLTKG